MRTPLTIALWLSTTVLMTGCSDDTGTDGSSGNTNGEMTPGSETATDSTTPEDGCGDGWVTGSEVCDDGVNDGTYGGCNPDCLSLAPYCGDMIPNGPEACDDANAEIDDGCLDNCQIPASCFELLQHDSMAPDGMYMIGPPGWPDPPFPSYCDMTSDGGGWTLAMRFAPMNGQFHFYSTHWTSASLVNEDVQDPTDPSDGKFWAYDFVPGNEIRGCLHNPIDERYGCKIYDLPMPAATLLDNFANVPVGSDASMQGHYFMDSDAGKLEWLSIQARSLDEASTISEYVEVGMNIDDDQSCYDARVRFGLVLNNEADVAKLNDAAGFGAQSYYTMACDVGPGLDSPWRTASGFAAGPNIYSTAGQIWVR